VWALAFTTVGWLAGALALRLFRGAEHYELPAIAIAVAVALAVWLALRMSRLHDRHAGPAVADA
jgi:membrane protein DedA with SNARE-associated domain